MRQMADVRRAREELSGVARLNGYRSPCHLVSRVQLESNRIWAVHGEQDGLMRKCLPSTRSIKAAELHDEAAEQLVADPKTNQVCSSHAVAH